ncbi:hypothetical protein CROQUDRAFT_154096 [Cronartium quercuum f. sp. fusiforme G11]|uniref:RNase H type-1 domain-containing protein n=1 Tax=Cronartium quercuum f. sp. fusiforme G11 TaxID=708437 RepID=A0A9P6NUW3_9BASI|nr:hypothetical protein CROQUDRAFT_154096 [Cronartium quercuum f. sp. fusiforme G11]
MSFFFVLSLSLSFALAFCLPTLVVHMEYMGIALGIAQFLDRLRKGEIENTDIGIFSDSQVALRAVSYPSIRPTSGQSLIRFLKNHIKSLPAETTLELVWAPGHEGIPLNEAVDKAAKLVASAEGRKTTLPTRLANLLQLTWKSLSVSFWRKATRRQFFNCEWDIAP